MITLFYLYLIITLLAVAFVIWIIRKLVNQNEEKDAIQYPSEVNQKLALDYEIIQTI